jgi:hypothetical protein
MFDAFDTEVIDPLADGRIEKESAYMQARRIAIRSARMIYECTKCGRLFLTDRENNLQCYVPFLESSKGILRSR